MHVSIRGLSLLKVCIKKITSCSLYVGELAYLTVSFIYVKCAHVCFPINNDEINRSATKLIMKLITFIGADSPETGPNLINVEFDDGDSAKIPLDHIRMLPVNYPVVSE